MRKPPENSNVLWEVSLCVTHDGWAPGKPESGTKVPEGPGRLVWFGGLCLKQG